MYENHSVKAVKGTWSKRKFSTSDRQIVHEHAVLDRVCDVFSLEESNPFEMAFINL